MQRYLYRVRYEYADGMTPTAGVTSAYEPVCVRALTQAEALTEVESATARYLAASGTTRTITLILTTADV